MSQKYWSSIMAEPGGGGGGAPMVPREKYRTARLLAGIGGPLGWVAFFSCFVNVLYLAAPLYMMQVYDRVMRSQSVPTLLYLTGAVALAYLVLSVLDTVRGQVLAGISDIVESRLGTLLLHRATAPTGTGARAGAGLLGRDLDTVRQFAAGPAILGFIDLPWAPIYLLVITTLHWSLGLFALGAACVLMALTVLAERVQRRPMAQANQVASRAYQFGDFITRYADCASTMGLGPHLSARWQALRRHMLAAQNQASLRAGLVGGVARFARLLTQSAILGFGAFLAIRHEIGAGAVFAASLLLGRTLAPVEAVIGSWRSTLAARDAFARIAEAAAPMLESALTLPPALGAIALEGVSWVPPGGERPALRRVSLRIEAGAVLAVIGPSAAGKSTLARVICGALRPRDGVVRLDGSEYASWNQTQLGGAIGYLPQDVALFPGSIADNIARFGAASDAAIIAAAQAARAHEMILRLPQGYATMIDENSAQLTGGQRQRVALARALFGDPPVLVLDEPNANLDAEGEAALIAAVIEARRRKRTVVMITHNVALVRVADFVATLVGGHVMKVQTAVEFLGRPAKIAVPA
jgi:PrtD family type I secretion system ABC transporter